MNRPFCLLPCWFNLFLPGAKATRYGIYFIAFLFCATPLFTLAQYSPNKQINHVSSKLSSEKVRSVIQDQKGFLWAATEDGLNKYDGYTFEVFKNIPGDSTSIPDNDVYTLATDPDGKIWAGYSNGWLTCYDHLTHHFSTLQAAATGLPEDLITRLFFDKRGRMWVAVKRHGLFYYDKINHRFIKAGDLPDIHPGYQINPTYYNNYNTIYDIYEDAQGSFWLATHDGLYQYNPVTNLFKSIRQKQIVPFEDRYDLFQKILISQEGFWLSSWGGGLTFYNIKTHEWKNYKMTTGSPGTHNIIESIEWKQDDQLWIASRDAGFGYFDITKGKFTFLYDSPCTKILKDRGEMIWVASDDEGLMQFDPTTLFSSQHVNVTRSDNGRHYFVNGIYHDLTTHQLFYGVAYGDGLHVYDELTQKETVHPFDVLPNSEQMLSVSSIYPDNRDSLWVLTTDYIYLFDRQHHSLKKFQQPFDNAPDRKKVITPDYYGMLRASGGDLWITSLNQGVLRYRFDEKGFTSYTKQGPYGLLSNSTKAIEEDGYQRIWMIAGNEISLFSYTDNRFHGIESFTSSATDLSKVKFSDLSKSPDGDIWISSDNGIYQYRHQSDSLQLVHWPPGKDIPSGKIKYIKSDQNGNVWFLTPSTLWCLQPKDKKITYSIATKIIESPSSFYIDQHNDIFLATYGGYSTFSPKKQSAQRNKPPLVITSFAVNNKVISLDSLKGKEVRLSHDQNSLTIEFSVLDFRNPSKNNYSFWMEGIDSDWRLSTDRHLADYGHLAPGHYTFKVKGIAEDGVWSDPVEIKIFIAPPLWATWYFVAAILLIICYFIYLLSRWRASVIRKEEVLKSAFEKKILETEMSTLRAQMNPHFIFNSLNSINRYILMADRDTASFYLTKFSKLIRLILENSNKTRISLDQELTALKHYIDMELLRFDHGFSYHIHIDEDVDPVFIQFPPLIIQPYVENSIWHGFIRRGTYGVLTITIKKETPEILLITVEDNGVGRNFKKKTLETSSKKSHGLKITEDRLSILSREGYTSSVQIIDLKNAEGEPSGTKVVIRISIIMVTQEKETIAL